MGNVGRVDDAAETSLAAATAVIITARWAAHAAPTSTPPGHGQGVHGQGVHDQGGPDQGSHAEGGHAAWAPPVPGTPANGNGHGHIGFATEDLGGRTLAGGGGGAANGFNESGTYGAGTYGAGMSGMYGATTAERGGPVPDERQPVVHDSRAMGSAAASFFAAAHMDAVPEVFPVPRIPGQRTSESPDDFSLGSVMADMPFPEPFEPHAFEPPSFEPQAFEPPGVDGGGFSAFGAPVQPSLAPDEVTGTLVPPGFERRTFGPSEPASEPATADNVGFSPPAEPPPSGFRAFAPPAPPPEFAQAEFAQSELARPDFAPAEFPPPGLGSDLAATDVAATGFATPEFGSSDFSEGQQDTFGAYSTDVDKFGGTAFGPGGLDPAGFGAPSFGGTDEPVPLPRPALGGEPEWQDAGGSRVALLPKRVPQTPDVPDIALFANDPLLDPSAAPPADGSELTRIATYLRDDEELAVVEPRPDGFDFADVLIAVRGVRDVRDAQLRWNSGAGHTLRIEFTDGADQGEVTRAVVRLLREKMGLNAAPSRGGLLRSDESTLDRPIPRPRASVIASASVPVRPAGSQPAKSGGVGEQPGTHPLPRPSGVDSSVARVVVDHVQVTTLGAEATVEVRLVLSRGGTAAGSAVGTGQGPAVDAYLLRLAATSAGNAVDQMLATSGGALGRCFVEHVAVVPFGVVEVAVVVLLLTHGGHTEEVAGSAIVAGDPRHAVVRATLAALNRRLESLLS